MTPPIKRYSVHIGFALAMLVMLVIGGTLYGVSNSQFQSSLWANHSQEVLRAVAEVDGAVSSAESAQRGYLLSGNDAFLADRARAMASANTAVQQVKTLTVDNPSVLTETMVEKTLADVQTADRLIAFVRTHQVDPRDVVMEVTESALATDVGHTLENLARLRMKGFGLSIDDYGTGYSSMQQLIRIAFTELKIDQSFVANAGRQESARVILEASLGMARKLNICSVAEGVETQADWDMLRQLGCHTVQGYFIARPMASADYFGWVHQWNRSR